MLRFWDEFLFRKHRQRGYSESWSYNKTEVSPGSVILHLWFELGFLISAYPKLPSLPAFGNSLVKKLNGTSKNINAFINLDAPEQYYHIILFLEEKMHHIKFWCMGLEVDFRDLFFQCSSSLFSKSVWWNHMYIGIPLRVRKNRSSA